jgi:hypothetical protein
MDLRDISSVDANLSEAAHKRAQRQAFLMYKHNKEFLTQLCNYFCAKKILYQGDNINLNMSSFITSKGTEFLLHIIISELHVSVHLSCCPLTELQTSAL